MHAGTTSSSPPSLLQIASSEVSCSSAAAAVSVVGSTTVGRLGLAAMGTRPPPPPGSQPWLTSYFGIFEDISTCLCGALCPCVLVGRIVEILDGTITPCCSAGTIYCCVAYCTAGTLGWAYTCNYRSRLRVKYGLPEEPCWDCLADCLCPFFSLTQMYRELKRRGINPSLGYVGNKHILDPPPELVPGQPPGSPGVVINNVISQPAPQQTYSVQASENANVNIGSGSTHHNQIPHHSPAAPHYHVPPSAYPPEYAPPAGYHHHPAQGGYYQPQVYQQAYQPAPDPAGSAPPYQYMYK